MPQSLCIVPLMGPVTTNTTAVKQFLSLADAAAEIGCTRRFLEMRIEDREIAVFRPSARLIRIKRTELDRWVESYSSTGRAAQ